MNLAYGSTIDGTAVKPERFVKRLVLKQDHSWLKDS